jgi:hypothetical protein
MRKIGILAATLLGASASVAFAAPPQQTNTFTVDCSRNQTISAAIARGDVHKPLILNIRGTCTEFIRIDRDNVTLHGDPDASINAPNSDSDLITIAEDGITLENLTLTGGYYGIRQDAAVRFVITKTVIQDTRSDGIRVFVGDTRVNDSTVQRAGGSGVNLTRGGSLGASNSRFLDNASLGIRASGNSTVSASGGRISGNVTGVLLEAGSHGSFSGVTISENTETGIKVAYSQAIIGNKNVISNNANWGIWVLNGSSAAINGNRIEDNGWDGVSGDIGSTLTMIGNQIRRNGAFGIACRTNCTIVDQGDTLENNGAGGFLLWQASKLSFGDNPTHWSGDGWGLQCADKESSVGSVGLFDGTVSDTCTDFNN